MENKLFIAVELAERILNDPELEQRLLKAWWNGKPGFQDTQDTPEQVVANLLKQDISAQYEFKYNRWGSVTAWTYASTPVVYFNTKNFMGRDICGVVGSLYHEYSHKKGYTHSSAKRILSVPYVIGTQAAQVCKKFLP